MQEFFDCANPQFHQLVSDDLAGEEAVCGSPGRAWLHVVVRPVKFSKTTLEAAYRKLTLNSLESVLMDIPVVGLPTAQSLNLRHLWHCVVTQLCFSGLLLSPAQAAPV